MCFSTNYTSKKRVVTLPLLLKTQDFFVQVKFLARSDVLINVWSRTCWHSGTSRLKSVSWVSFNASQFDGIISPTKLIGAAGVNFSGRARVVKIL